MSTSWKSIRVIIISINRHVPAERNWLVRQR